MPCYSPIHGYRARRINISGKRSIVFNTKAGFIDLPQKIPCYKCIGCRLERARQTAIRCMHEASLYDENSFLTLTYSNENMPKHGFLVHKDFQLFMKRLRDKVYPKKVRYYMCGEYGSKNQRPHYHCLLFNHSFNDKRYHKKNNGYPIYTSGELDKLWHGQGHCYIGNITFDSASYVARYVTKKVYGKDSFEHYCTDILDKNGEFLQRPPEYTKASQSLAKEWIQKYADETYSSDSIVIKGKEYKPPKYYDIQFEKIDSRKMAEVRMHRRIEGKKYEWNQTPDRLSIRNEIAEARFNNSNNRSYENET